MTDNKLYIYGAGGHAQVVGEAARLLGYKIVAFVEDNSSRLGQIVYGAPIISGQDLPRDAAIVCAFGNCHNRLALGRKLQNGYRKFPAIIHPRAYVSNYSNIGCGVFIGAGAVIDPGVTIKDFVIVNNGALVCHDSVLGAGCHICPGAALAGAVKIGETSWIGLGCQVIEKITIGKNVLIGAGAVVVDDMADNVIAWGTPARKKNN